MTNPKPTEVLEYIAAAMHELSEARWDGIPIGRKYQEDIAEVDSSITLADIKAAVVLKMAAKKQVFDSGYRHEISPEHSIVRRMLGSTVELNARISAAMETIREAKA